MQTININKHCCPSGPQKPNWKKRWAKTNERGMPVKSLGRIKPWMVGGTLFSLVLMLACQSKQVQKPIVPVKVSTIEIHVTNSRVSESATSIAHYNMKL